MGLGVQPGAPVLGVSSLPAQVSSWVKVSHAPSPWTLCPSGCPFSAPKILIVQAVYTSSGTSPETEVSPSDRA